MDTFIRIKQHKKRKKPAILYSCLPLFAELFIVLSLDVSELATLPYTF